MRRERRQGKRSGRVVIRRIWVTVGLPATVAFVGWSLIAYRASREARASLELDSGVSVMHEDGVPPDRRAIVDGGDQRAAMIRKTLETLRLAAAVQRAD